MDSYRIPTGNGASEYVEKRSRFLGLVQPVRSEDEAREIIAACKKLRTQIDFGMFLPVQKAAIAALTGPLDMVKAQCGLYQQRRDALCGGLRSIG